MQDVVGICHLSFRFVAKFALEFKDKGEVSAQMVFQTHLANQIPSSY